MDDLKVYGRLKGWCPYFMARKAVSNAQLGNARVKGSLLDYVWHSRYFRSLMSGNTVVPLNTAVLGT